MAEERILDDDVDKSKKYRIVKGEDGEDELIIDEVQEEEDLSFDAPELVEDDELGVLTAEQYEEARILREEEEARLNEQLNLLKSKTIACLGEDKFTDALDCIAAAEELAPESGDIKCAKLEAVTRKFTDFAAVEKIISVCEEVKTRADKEQRRDLYTRYGGEVERLKSQNAAELEKVSAQYAEEQQARREILTPRKKKALKNFIISLAVFAAFLIAAIVCSTVMFSMQNGVMVAITIVLAIAALAAFVVFILASRAYVTAARMSAVNERDFSTKLGREKMVLTEFCQVLDIVYSAFYVKNDDIS